MDGQVEATMKAIRPFWGRVAVVESPVDEIGRDSGLVVPLKHDGPATFRRGVVVSVDSEWSDPDRVAACELIVPGTIVYFRGGVLIVDVYVVEISDILAYEPS